MLQLRSKRFKSFFVAFSALTIFILARYLLYPLIQHTLIPWNNLVTSLVGTILGCAVVMVIYSWRFKPQD